MRTPRAACAAESWLIPHAAADAGSLTVAEGGSTEPIIELGAR